MSHGGEALEALHLVITAPGVVLLECVGHGAAELTSEFPVQAEDVSQVLLLAFGDADVPGCEHFVVERAQVLVFGASLEELSIADVAENVAARRDMNALGDGSTQGAELPGNEVIDKLHGLTVHQFRETDEYLGFSGHGALDPPTVLALRATERNAPRPAVSCLPETLCSCH